MNITIIYVGGAKDGYISEGCAEFEKRIGAYAKLSQIELRNSVSATSHLPRRASWQWKTKRRG